MLLIPAVDIKDGKCVRLLKGRAEDVTVYFDDPVDAAKKWVEGGAELIHVVDLDGAFSGKMTNTDIIGRIAREAGDVRIEASGGIRSADDVARLLGLGVDRVVIGTVAAESPGKLALLCGEFPGRIAVGIDAERDMVAIQGWTSVTDLSLLDFVKHVCEAVPVALMYTDVSRDGALAGPNVDRIRDVCSASSVPVVASGGVSSLDDLKRLRKLRLEGVIVGKALFENIFTLPEGIDALRT